MGSQFKLYLAFLAILALGFLSSFASLQIVSKYADVPKINNCYITQIKWECGGKCDSPTPDGYYAAGWPIKTDKKLFICGETTENTLDTGKFALNGMIYSLILVTLIILGSRFEVQTHHKRSSRRRS
ncbi:hypothetical protein KW794_03030 [Candidatus Saccharibacteria bacterium]|nr:hypothetical protein [Candidatus Saccharibacteria bacterium]